jgi:hypothetical protein
MGFRDLPGLRRHYAGQASQLINEFYIPVLSQAGYFDSASLVQLAAGLAAFIRHAQDSPGLQTRMRVITGATWSPEDRAAYQRGIEALQESLNYTLVRHFEPTDDESIRLGLPPLGVLKKTISPVISSAPWPGWWPLGCWRCGSPSRSIMPAARTIQGGMARSTIPKPASSTTPTVTSSPFRGQ